MATDPNAVRHQLAVLCRRKAARVLGWPRQWRPYEIMNPKTGEPFTDPEAWDLVADLLQDVSIALEEVLLDSPPGKTGYVVEAALNERSLYVKVQLGAGKIIGRSFHYSEY